VSVQDEREFRERLGGLLDGIEPAPAPVFRAMRQGRGIRMRRWISAAAALAVLAGVGAAMPFLLHQEGRVAPAAHPHYSVTVNQPGPHWRPGLIASGTQDGHDWSVVITGHGNNTSVTGGGMTNGLGPVAPLAGSPVQISMGWGGSDSSYTFIGIVRSDVTSVAIAMSNGETLNLIPVAYQGQRFIAMTIPRGARILRAEALHGTAEIAYSIPYEWTSLDNWWLPSQTPPSRVTKTLAAGVFNGQAWRIQAQFGPWGYCFAAMGNSACDDGLHPYQMSAGRLDQPITCEPSGGNIQEYSVFAVLPDIQRVVVSFHGQPRASYRPVEVAGLHFLVILPRHGSIASAIAYNAAGQRVGALTDLSCGK
jgi:hypothetical protein